METRLSCRLSKRTHLKLGCLPCWQGPGAQRILTEATLSQSATATWRKRQPSISPSREAWSEQQTLWCVCAVMSLLPIPLQSWTLQTPDLITPLPQKVGFRKGSALSFLTIQFMCLASWKSAHSYQTLCAVLWLSPITSCWGTNRPCGTKPCEEGVGSPCRLCVVSVTLEYCRVSWGMTSGSLHSVYVNVGPARVLHSCHC